MSGEAALPVQPRFIPLRISLRIHPQERGSLTAMAACVRPFALHGRPDQLFSRDALFPVGAGYSRPATRHAPTAGPFCDRCLRSIARHRISVAGRARHRLSDECASLFRAWAVSVTPESGWLLSRHGCRSPFACPSTPPLAALSRLSRAPVVGYHHDLPAACRCRRS